LTKQKYILFRNCHFDEILLLFVELLDGELGLFSFLASRVDASENSLLEKAIEGLFCSRAFRSNLAS